MPASEQTQQLVSSQGKSFHVEEPKLPPKVPAPKLGDLRADVDLERPSLKRKEVESSGSNRFKVVSQLVIAMRRFQASLNPIYTYGKRTPSNSADTPGGSFNSRRGGATPEPQEVSSGESSRQLTPGVSARQFTRRGEPGQSKTPRSSRVDYHGNKTSFLFKPLPPLPGEAGAEDSPGPVGRTVSGRSIGAPPS